jgi:transcriptional regulator with XRE-family HTH domain
MNIDAIKKDLDEVLTRRGLSQVEFAEIHGLSYSWINKFLNGKAANPTINSLNELQAAIEKERGAEDEGAKKKPVAPASDSPVAA